MTRLGRIGVDVGGTFTDIVTITDGEVAVTKVPSTPEAEEAAIFDGLDESGLPPAETDFLAHGTTVGTNAVLEREWAPTALVTTNGFRDVLEIGRQARPNLYDLQGTKPEPIVSRNRRFEVQERLDEHGDVTRELDLDSVETVVDEIADVAVESVAISLLFSYENDEHERRIAEVLEEEAPTLSVSLSSRVLPEIREYERTLATALNAALKPIIDRYIDRFERGLAGRGYENPLRIMQSNGGIIGADRTRERPINTLLSGPAAGVQGASHVADLAGWENVITMDMGGTSCDVSVIEGGDPVVSTDVTVGDYPIGVPMVDVHTIGAGGGSIAWIDDGGALRVGPRSASARPGPIAYGRGGGEPTVTDAHVVLGRIDTASFPGEQLTPAPAAAREGIASTIGKALERPLEEAALGILDVANANMERAIRVMTVERGLDPREFALVAYGGAGPLHAPTIARELDIPVVLVPRSAGVLSALGLVLSDLVRDFSTSRVRRWDAIDPAEISDRFEEFAEQGIEQLAAEGIAPDAIEIEPAVDLRYRGQSFSLRIPTDRHLDAGSMDAIADRFHQRHATRYGHAAPDESVELVTIRLRARGRISPPDLGVDDTGPVDPEPRTVRPVTFDSDERQCPIYDRDCVLPKTRVEGPAIIEGIDSTVLVHPDQHGTVDAYGTMAIRTAGENR